MNDRFAELEALLGPAVTNDPAALRAHASDMAPLALLDRRAGTAIPAPDRVVRPSSTDEVASLLGWANATRTSVVAFGGGSGVCRAIAPEGGVVLDTVNLDQISPVDAKSRLVIAGAGVTGPALTASLAGEGFMLGHEPQSLAVSTVGGWVATRACGQLSARYGGIEDLIAGLEAVLADGTVIRHGPVPRRATGPDVMSLLIGSEGTLGVVTRVWLRVTPIPAQRVDRAVTFEHMADGVAACRALAQSELNPTLARLYDTTDAAIAFRALDAPPSTPVLLLSFDGRDAEGRAAEAVTLSKGTLADEALTAHWWEHRNDAVAELGRIMAGEGILGPHAALDTMEVAGSWSVLRDLYHSMVDALTPEADIVGCHLSHLYPDGACLYFTLASACGSDDEARARITTWWETGMRTCLDAGGTISHHHGIGRLKAPWLQEELGGAHGMLVAVKNALDPNGILNPGALGL